MLSLIHKPPFYACIRITDCVPCLPLYGIQGGISFGRIIDSDAGKCLKNPVEPHQGFFYAPEQIKLLNRRTFFSQIDTNSCITN